MSSAITTSELILYLNKTLNPHVFRDFCPNGLQVQGKTDIKKIISGVTACQALFEKASLAQADMILVHHGLFWKGDDVTITKNKYQRIKALLENDINLIAYHLPLDAHEKWGNNAQIGLKCGFKKIRPIELDKNPNLGYVGELKEPLSHEDFKAMLSSTFENKVISVKGQDTPIQRVGWCSGGAQKYLHDFLQHGVDAYITGEASLQTIHDAEECGAHFFAVGHHASEKWGVQALGEHLADKFGLAHEFIDIPNPI